jgi:hypothetical protein
MAHYFWPTTLKKLKTEKLILKIILEMMDNDLRKKRNGKSWHFFAKREINLLKRIGYFINYRVG